MFTSHVVYFVLGVSITLLSRSQVYARWYYRWDKTSACRVESPGVKHRELTMVHYWLNLLMCQIKTTRLKLIYKFIIP